MCSPKQQNYHSSVRVDDKGIGDDDRLLRQCRTPFQIVPCPTNGWRLSSQAFVSRPSEVGVSIDLECLIIKSGKTWHSRYKMMPDALALAAFSAGNARQHSAGVAWTPKPEEPEHEQNFARSANEFHGEIIAPIDRKNSRSIAEVCVILQSEPSALPTMTSFI
jgi:hypothetical protein